MPLLTIVIVACLMNCSLAFGGTISKTGGNYLTPVYIDNPGSYTSSVTISDLPSGAKITNVKAVYEYGHCPYDDLKVTLSKSRGDVTPIQLMDDWTPSYVTQNWTYNNWEGFANANPNDTWSLKVDINGNGCPNATCNPAYHGHEGYFYEWTLTITYDVQPVTTAPSSSSLSPAKRFFTGSTSATTVGFSWGAVTNADSYRLDIFDDITGGLVQEGTPTATSFTSTPLLALHKYNWNVAGVNPTGTGPFSEMRKILIGPAMECWPEVGNGNGQYFDTCYDLNSNIDSYQLKDISRRGNMDISGHNGHMLDSASITTQQYPNTSGPTTDTDNVWSASWQVSDVDAHFNAGTTYDYLNSRFYLPPPYVCLIRDYFLQNSMITIARSQASDNCSGSLFDPNPPTSTVTYCARNPNNSTIALGRIAHEWGHAVSYKATSRGYNVGLGISREGGTMDESFSDWIATAVKQANPANGDNGWIMTLFSTTRNLSNPLLSSPAQPIWYGGANWKFCGPSDVPNDSNDYCGLHQNTGVPNQMFYLLSQVIGTEKAIKIAYKANVNYWKTDTPFNFLKAREGMISAATELFGSISYEVDQVKRNWDAVGVTATSTPESLNGKRAMPAIIHYLLDL